METQQCYCLKVSVSAQLNGLKELQYYVINHEYRAKTALSSTIQLYVNLQSWDDVASVLDKFIEVGNPVTFLEFIHQIELQMT